MEAKRMNANNIRTAKRKPKSSNRRRFWCCVCATTIPALKTGLVTLCFLLALTGRANASQAVFAGEVTSASPSTFTPGVATTVTVRIRSTSGSGNVYIEADTWPPGWSVTPKNYNPTITQGTYYDQSFTVTPTSGVGSSGTIVWKLYDDDFGIHPSGSVLLATRNQSVSAPFDTTAPSVPTLSSPANAAITTDNTVSLDWIDSTDASGISNYEVQVDDSSGFGSPNYSATPTSSSATTSALADGLYYWRVRAKDNAGNWTSYSASRTFRVDTTAPTTPSLSSPSNGSSTSDQTPTFDWADSTDSGGSGVSYYEFEAYDYDITWGDITTTTTSSTYTPPSNIPFDTIYWRVRAVDSAGNKSAWSAEWSVIIVDGTAPTVPSLSSPSDGSATSDNTVALDWSDSSDSGAGVSNYEVQVDDSSSFSSPNYSATPGSSSSTTSALADGLYYWRARAKDNAGNWSSWSSSRSFRVDTTAPSVPTLSSPATGSSTGDQTPTFDWSDSTDSGSGLNRYEIEVYDGDITWSDISATTTVSTFTPGSNIPFDRLYWRVRSVDNVGNVSAWSTEFWFDLVDDVTPSVPSLVLPADGSRTASSSVALDWNDSTDSGTGVSNYEVQVDDSSSFASPNYSATPSSSSATTSPLADGLYYWRVRAKDNAGNWSTWSSSRTFRVDTTPPTVPTLLVPANGSSTGDQTPTFDWTDSSDSGSGLSHYEVEIYDGDITWGDIATTVTASTFTPGIDIPFDRIYWKIRAVDNVGNKSAWSTEFWFDLVDNVAPSVPSLASPADASQTANNSVALDWNDSTDSGTGVSNYEVQVDDSSSFTSPNYSATPSSSSATTSALSDGVYYWRVRAKDNANNWSAWSSSRTFRVDTTAPTAPALLLPVNGGSTGDQTPTFDWTDASDGGSGLSHYEVEIYDGDITWGDISTTVTASTYTPGSNIPFDRIYWKIRAVDNVGNKSAWSTEFWFDLVNNAPTQPGAITPSNVTSNSASIAWVASTDSDGDTITYEVEYGVNNTPGWTSAGTTNTQSRLLTSLQPETTYVVRVRATDGKGGASSWRELDPAFTTLPVRGIASAYWLPRPPVSVHQGTIVTLRAEVAGFSVGTVFAFTIYEDDPDGNDVVTNLTGQVYATNGTFYADAQWTAQWADDGVGQGDPEYYFVASSGGISKDSGTSTSEELLVERRNAWHTAANATDTTLSSASPNLTFTFTGDDLPPGVKLAQVALIWDVDLGQYGDNELELTCFGPNWQKTGVLRLTAANRTGEISFDRDSFTADFAASPGTWGIRIENLTSAKGAITVSRLDLVVTYFTALTENPLPASANSNRKVVVSIHGWNPQNNTFAEHYGFPWSDLNTALIDARTTTPGWDVTRYNWVADAATGPAGLNSQANAVASRDAAVAHALHLAKELESKYPNLEQVQLVAHSAGNWVARGAARYLKTRFPNAKIQVTSLDAFIPSGAFGTADGGMPANLAIFREMAGWSLVRLDNYYVVDVSQGFHPDSDFIFGQTSSDFAGWQINRQLDADGDFAPRYDDATMNEHSGPILWYARSVEACNAGNSSALGELGFATSLMFTEARAQIDSITPNVAQPPLDSITFQGSATVNGGSVAAWEWSSSMDGILSTGASFTKSSHAMSVGPHAISFRIRDNQGNWSDSVSANITVNNALPTATMSGIPGTPVLAGTVLSLTLGGQDNDENGQSVTAGELSVSGSIVATPLGSYNFTVPAQAGDYTISYRVRDDEGAWSGPTNRTLTVQSPPCSFTLASSSANFGPAGGNGSVTVTASSSDCVWQSSNPLSWVTITSGASGTSNGTLNYTVAPNISTSSRSGAITIADQPFTITQAGTLNPWLAVPRRLMDGVMQITLTGEAGRTYVIEVSPDVSNWTPIHTNIANGGVLQFDDTDATNSSTRFYRGRLQ